MNFSKKNILYITLCAIFLTNAIVAEIIGGKIFSAEAIFGLAPAQLTILGNKLDFNMSAGVLNWPVVFIVSDIINEYFGVKGVKRISYLTAVLISYCFVILYGATLLPPAHFWLDIYKFDANGNHFNINEAFGKVLQQGMGIIIGSLVAFLIGQLLDAYVFHKLKLWTGHKHIWLRSTGSTLFSQLIDSFVVIFIAFYVFGKWDIKQVLAVGTINYIYKFVVAVVLTPVIYFVHNVINNYLGKELSHEMMNESIES